MKLQIAIFYTIWILFAIIIAIGFANYYYFNTLSLNYHIVTLLVKTYPFTTIFVIILLIIIIIYQFKIYREKIRSRRNCQITYVDLEKIAHLWLEYEEIEDNIEHKMMEKMEVSFDESKKDIQEVINTLIGNRSISDMSFYKKYVFNYLDSFSKQELEIIAVLYELLETKAKDLPSVATLFKSDTDKNIYKDIVSEKLTSYEILYKVNLFDHTMNVVDCIYDILIKEKDSFVFSWSKMLISALSHDIGKIEKIDSLKGLSGLDKGKYENNTHENISRLILSNAFPNYEYIDDVCEIIEKHHLTNLDEKNKNYKAIRNLRNADHSARKQEIKEYLNNKKYENKKVLNIETDESKTLEINTQNTTLFDISVLDIDDKNEEDKEKKDEFVEQNSNDIIKPDQEIIFNPINIGNFIEQLLININKVLRRMHLATQMHKHLAS
ncbi:HD domain-containing protein [Arcobacter butzleri]|uniref:HD domain-containing protein n=1 Tax=Aliarcobacter butzleri TaxID=28197 RepID=UPI001587D045|nr:HD domain-containing protein [Aliarcobacter butzleri]NUW27141.1 HD domain-containing protein [Aliarcobacter butzleri]